MDRLIAYFNQLVRKAVASLPYAGVYDYSVTACNPLAQTLDARSLSADMPDLTGVPMISPGLFLHVTPGTTIKIGFSGMSPAAPYVADYGSGGSSSVGNEVQLGWLVASQVTSPPGTVTMTYMPLGPIPPPPPIVVALPNTPTPLTPTGIAFALTAGKVTTSPLTTY